MASITTITWPAIRTPATFDWRLDRFDASFRSPTNGYQQDLARTGAAFAFSVGWPAINDDERVLMEVFLSQLKKAGYRTKPPIFAYQKRGALTGAPLVNGGAQSGLTLITDGWTHGVTKIGAAGDFIQLATNQLIRLTQDVNSDGSGNATLHFEPALRNAPADNSALTVADPRALFKLNTNPESILQQPGRLAALSLDFIEDIFNS